MKIEWTETARQDRRNIYDYLEERNPIAAIEIDDLIEEIYEVEPFFKDSLR